MRAAVRAGLAYFALIFALGFAFGVLRVLVMAPLWGERVAILVELPIMVLASWFACGWALKHFRVSSARGARAVMGAAAFASLMIAEIFVSAFAFDRSLAEHARHVFSESNRLGLAGQIAFGLIPLLRK